MGLSTRGKVDRVLVALADPNRRRVVELLRERPRTAGEIARAIGLNPTALSRHLRNLRRGGLIEDSHPEFDTRVRIYSLRPTPMADLKRWLEDTERLWANRWLPSNRTWSMTSELRHFALSARVGFT